MPFRFLCENPRVLPRACSLPNIIKNRLAISTINWCSDDTNETRISRVISNDRISRTFTLSFAQKNDGKCLSYILHIFMG